MRPSPEELAAFHGATVPDLVGEHRPLLVLVGINPSLLTAATGAHFAHPSNRFYAALHAAGITDRRLDPSGGLSAADEAQLLSRGVAITNVVARATARAAELDDAELRAGARRLVTRLKRWRPRVVAIAGVTAYRVAFGRHRARIGRQEDTLASAELWVVPNPSGLNAHEDVGSLARWYRRAARAAGVC